MRCDLGYGSVSMVQKVKVTLESPPTDFDIVRSTELLPINLSSKAAAFCHLFAVSLILFWAHAEIDQIEPPKLDLLKSNLNRVTRNHHTIRIFGLQLAIEPQPLFEVFRTLGGYFYSAVSSSS